MGQLYGWLPLSNAYGIPSLAGSDADTEGLIHHGTLQLNVKWLGC